MVQKTYSKCWAGLRTFLNTSFILFFKFHPKNILAFSSVVSYNIYNINPIQDEGAGGEEGGCKKVCPVTSTNLRITQNFLTFSFNPFASLATPSTSPKLVNMNQEQPSEKKWFFGQNWDYDNFSHRNVRVTKRWSHDHIYNLIWVTW